jgi:hypothetical protein
MCVSTGIDTLSFLFFSLLFLFPFFVQFPTSASTLFAEFVLEGAAVVEDSGGAIRVLGVWLVEGG